MIVDVIFDNVKIYDIQDRLDVVKGVSFSLEITEELPEDFDVFSNKDSVLNISDSLAIKAENIGESKLRFMVGDEIVKDLIITVVDKVSPLAVELGSKLGIAIPK